MNADKFALVPYTHNKTNLPPLLFKGITTPSQISIKYLGIVLDKSLTWGPHQKVKRKLLNTRLHLWRLILNSKLPLKNKLLIYKSMIRTVWANSAQI